MRPESEGGMDWAELTGYLMALSRCPRDQLLQYDTIREALERWRDKVKPCALNQVCDTVEPEGQDKLWEWCVCCQGWAAAL